LEVAPYRAEQDSNLKTLWKLLVISLVGLIAVPALAQAPSPNAEAPQIALEAPNMPQDASESEKQVYVPLSEEHYIVAQYVPELPPQPKGVYSPFPGSCLASVQYWIDDFPKGVGTPKNVETKYETPAVGLAILTTEGPVGHIGQVISFTSDTVTFRECNYSPGKCGTRTLPLDSDVIRGYR